MVISKLQIGLSHSNRKKTDFIRCFNFHSVSTASPQKHFFSCSLKKDLWIIWQKQKTNNFLKLAGAKGREWFGAIPPGFDQQILVLGERQDGYLIPPSVDKIKKFFFGIRSSWLCIPECMPYISLHLFHFYGIFVGKYTIQVSGYGCPGGCPWGSVLFLGPWQTRRNGAAIFSWGKRPSWVPRNQRNFQKAYDEMFLIWEVFRELWHNWILICWKGNWTAGYFINNEYLVISVVGCWMDKAGKIWSANITFWWYFWAAFWYFIWKVFAGRFR